MKTLKLENFKIGNQEPMTLMGGVNVLESESIVMTVAEKFAETTEKLNINWIFKGSFDKANRSSISSFRGPGLDEGLKILERVKSEFNVPVITDIHDVNDANHAAKYVDILQIPAFLVRQTDLLVAAAKTNKVINLKKGQFMSPESMQFAVNKIIESGNQDVMITDRGTMFGYQDLIVDFRGIPTMKSYATTVLDVTHSLQKPNQTSGVTGGLPNMIETIARAGVVNGVDGLFIETHYNPKSALSDGKNMLPIDKLEEILERLISVRKTINSFNS